MANFIYCEAFKTNQDNLFDLEIKIDDNILNIEYQHQLEGECITTANIMNYVLKDVSDYDNCKGLYSYSKERGFQKATDARKAYECVEKISHFLHLFLDERDFKKFQKSISSYSQENEVNENDIEK